MLQVNETDMSSLKISILGFREMKLEAGREEGGLWMGIRL